jgi:BirA family biotin operon repressor/biotin-[acetyl-CoA-carboxylase] ligase
MLDPASLALVSRLEVFAEIESTNTYLREQPPPARGNATVAIAATQTGGRGRLNNRWHSPPGSGLYMSVAYTFDAVPSQISGVTLGAGVAAMNALERLSVDRAMLKWPNDIVLNDGKLGGILTELRHAGDSDRTVIVGIGINIAMGGEKNAVEATIGRIADLSEAILPVPNPIDLAALVLHELLIVVLQFERQGITAFTERWREFDWLSGKPVRVASAADDIRGLAAGIDDDGALLIRSGERLLPVTSGSVSLDTRQAL